MKYKKKVKKKKKIKKKNKRQKKAQENAERMAGISIILDQEIVSKLKSNHLLDQIKLFKAAGAPNLQGSIPKLADEKRQALVNAVKLYKDGLWLIDSAEDWESESEDFDTSDTDSD